MRAFGGQLTVFGRPSTVDAAWQLHDVAFQRHSSFSRPRQSIFNPHFAPCSACQRWTVDGGPKTANRALKARLGA
jgi:hypothetical protein